MKTYLFFTSEDCMATKAMEPTRPRAIITAESKTGALAAVVGAIKQGQLTDINLKDSHLLDIQEFVTLEGV